MLIILALLKSAEISKRDGYWIPRTSHFMGKDVKFGGWNDKVIRLFRKSKCKYQDIQVHAEIIDNGNIGMLNSKLHHNTYVTFDLQGFRSGSMNEALSPEQTK